MNNYRYILVPFICLVLSGCLTSGYLSLKSKSYDKLPNSCIESALMSIPGMKFELRPPYSEDVVFFYWFNTDEYFGSLTQKSTSNNLFQLNISSNWPAGSANFEMQLEKELFLNKVYTAINKICNEQENIILEKNKCEYGETFRFEKRCPSERNQ